MAEDPGWRIDPVTLREVVIDRALLTARLHTAAAADRVWLLRILGDLERSAVEGEAVLAGGGPPGAATRIRPLLLLGHTRSWQRDWERATELHTEALALATGTRWEAAAHQHWGKCLFEQGRYLEAAEEFAAALQARRAAGADPDLVASSTTALDRAHELAHGASCVSAAQCHWSELTAGHA